MSPFEAYLFLFFDELLATLIIVPHNPFVFSSLMTFSSPTLLYPMLSAFAMVSAQLLNYMAGFLLTKVPINTTKTPENTLQNLSFFVNKYGAIIALLSCFKPLGAIILVIFGLLKIKLKKIILSVAISSFSYYLYQYLFFSP